MEIKKMLPISGKMKTDFIQSEIVQKELFNLGYSWRGHGTDVLKLDYHDFAIVWYAEDKNITWMLCRKDNFDKKPNQECRFEDYFELKS